MSVLTLAWVPEERARNMSPLNPQAGPTMIFQAMMHKHATVREGGEPMTDAEITEQIIAMRGPMPATPGCPPIPRHWKESIPICTAHLAEEGYLERTGKKPSYHYRVTPQWEEFFRQDE